MSDIKPLNALRPSPGRESEVSSLPYDVFYDREVREIISANPNSFLTVTRPEGNFPESAAASREEILASAKANLERLISDGTLVHDDEPAFYIYRLTVDGHSQTGIIGCCSLDEYESGRIKRHEFTRPDKVEDRTEHIVGLRAQTGLIFLAYRSTDLTAGLFRDAVEGTPLYDLTAENGVRHEIWRDTDTQKWSDAFAEVAALYVADGHHRLESAKQAREVFRNRGEATTGGEQLFDRVIAGVFPDADLRILPYNRAVADLNGLSAGELLEKLSGEFDIVESSDKTPAVRAQICMYLDGRWYLLKFRSLGDLGPDPKDRLDVSILQNRVLTPIFGIDDPRTDKRIAFVGGSRGVAELERLVDSGEAAVAFSMFPTTMADLLAVSDANEIMPPKSTWFEPKLRDGLVVYEI